jgi:regulator of protease activity HflC (stomatin/prohibitin superfamily)
VGPGKAGVIWRSTSGTDPQAYPEGAYLLAWWNHMDVYDLRLMSHDELLDVITVNGLAIKLDTSVRYQAQPGEIVKLAVEIGPDYYGKVLEPVLRSEARRVMGQYTPEEIYSTKRDVIERQIREGVQTKIQGKHLALEAVLIRNVELPEAIRQAIDAKLAAEQDVLKMKYMLELATSQAEQKRIEAKGIADYNTTIAASLSAPILEFERIQELARLADSPNAKSIVLGPGVNPDVLLAAPAAGAAPPGPSK